MGLLRPGRARSVVQDAARAHRAEKTPEGDGCRAPGTSQRRDHPSAARHVGDAREPLTGWAMSPSGSPRSRTRRAAGGDAKHRSSERASPPAVAEEPTLHRARLRFTRQACRVSGFDVNAGRIDRLRQEIDDEQVWLPTDPYLADAVLAELDYARHPHAHEGVAPRYGALVVADAPAVEVADRSTSSRSATCRWMSRGAWPTDARRSSCEGSAGTTRSSVSTARTSTSRRPCT